MGRVATFRRWARPVAFIALYVAAAEITDGLTLESGFSPWYPPAGITLAYLVVVGPRGAATVLAGRFLSIWVAAPEAWRNEPDGVIVRALAIVGCAVAGAHVLRRVRLEHVRLRELAWFVGVGVVAVPLGAAMSVAAVSVLLLGEGGRAAFDAARTVWVGDAIAVATIAPAALLVVAARAGAVRSRPVTTGRAARVETVLQVVALVGAPVVALAVAEELDATAFLCLAVLPVIWVAVRGNLVFAAIGLLVVNVTLTAFAALALENTARLSELQVVMLAAALGALYVVVVSHSQDALVAELVESEGRLRTIVENVPCTIVRFDLDGGVRFASQPCQDGEDDAVSLMVQGLQATWPTLTEPIAKGEVVEHQWQARTPDGARWFSARLGGEHRADGTLHGVVAMISDLTPKHQTEAELARERWEDRLTGLANRRRFLDLLGPLAAREGGALAIAVIDIDGFSRVNDGIGHERADDVLREVSERLARRAGTRGVAARLGGDEFALALPVESLQSAHGLAQELLEELRITVPLGERSLLVTGSVGVACDASGAAGVDLLYDAESALHTAKEAGGGRAAAFEVGRRLATLERGARLTLLREALDSGSIVVHYQPIVELDSGEILSVEALVRLPDPVSGQLLPPGAFIDLVEEAGLDLALGTAVRRRAFADLAGWIERGAAPLTLALNVTARELVEPEFVPQLLDACAQHGLQTQSVCLELTERTVTADLAAATRALTQLRTHGVQAALDDFGIGYSSMAYLRRLPVDVLKIDRSFVAGLPDDPDDAAIVSLIVGLSSALGLDVTAEGIENDEQRDALLALGCRRGQGFLFARPMDAATIADRLAAPLVGGA